MEDVGGVRIYFMQRRFLGGQFFQNLCDDSHCLKEVNEYYTFLSCCLTSCVGKLM